MLDICHFWRTHRSHFTQQYSSKLQLAYLLLKNLCGNYDQIGISSIAEDIMKRTLFLAVVLILLIVSSTGCLNSGMFLSANVTDVRLSEDNFDIVATNITGSSKAGYILGLSFGPGAQVSTAAIARVIGTGMLYQEALKNLWENYEKDHGPREGKKIALVNVHYDTDIVNLILYTEVKLFIRADVVEFK